MGNEFARVQGIVKTSMKDRSGEWINGFVDEWIDGEVPDWFLDDPRLGNVPRMGRGDRIWFD